MYERIRLDNRDLLKIVAVVGVGTTALTACGGSGETSAISNPTHDGPVATSTTHPGSTESSTPSSTKTETQNPTSTETSNPTSYNKVLTNEVPSKVSYMDAIPKLDAQNEKLHNMMVVDFQNLPIEQRISFSKVIAPGQIIQEWAEQNGALPYTTPSDNMTGLQVVNNFFTTQAFLENKVGISDPAGPGTKPTIDPSTVEKCIASMYTLNGKMFDGSHDSAYKDYMNTIAFLGPHSSYNGEMQKATVANSTVLEVKDMGRINDYKPDNNIAHDKKQILVDVKGQYKKNGVNQAFDQQYAFADMTGKGDWAVTKQAQLEPEQYRSDQGTIEKNPTSLSQ